LQIRNRRLAGGSKNAYKEISRKGKPQHKDAKVAFGGGIHKRETAGRLLLFERDWKLRSRPGASPDRKKPHKKKEQSGDRHTESDGGKKNKFLD